MNDVPEEWTAETADSLHDQPRDTEPPSQRDAPRVDDVSPVEPAPAPDALAGSSKVPEFLQLDNARLEQLLEDEVAEKLETLVHEKVSQEEDRRFKQLKWIAAFIGLVGLGTFGTLANYLIEKAVDTRIERSAGDISEALGFVRFANVVLKIELHDSFTQDEVDYILAYLRAAENDEGLRHSEDFRIALYQIAKSFAAAGQSASLDEIFAAYEREILAAPTIVQALLHHYGQEIVGRLEIEDDNFGYQVFCKLERVAASSRVPELALAYRFLFESKYPEGTKSARVEEILERTLDLSDEDRERFFAEIFMRSRAENWTRMTTPEVREIEQTVRKLGTSASEAMRRLYSPEVAELWQRLLSDGVLRDDIAAAAHFISETVSGEVPSRIAGGMAPAEYATGPGR